MTQSLMIAAYIMFVSRLILLVSVSHGIKYMTVEYMPNIMAPVLSKYLEKVYNIYLRRGFTVNLFLMDRKFECLHDIMSGYSDLNITTEKEYTEDIERQILIVK